MERGAVFYGAAVSYTHLDVYKRQIKSVSLLPKKEEEAALKQELTGQLLEYQQCKEAAMRLRERFSLDGIVRAQADIPADLTYKRHHKPQEDVYKRQE